MTTLTFDLAAALAAKHPRGFFAPVDIPLDTFLDYADDDWDHELDLDDLLAAHQLIGVVWNVNLVREQRPDLTDDQAWAVLQACQPHFETVTAEMRRTVRRLAVELFPPPTACTVLRDRLLRLHQQVEALPVDVTTDPAGFGAASAALDTVETLLKGITA